MRGYAPVIGIAMVVLILYLNWTLVREPYRAGAGPHVTYLNPWFKSHPTLDMGPKDRKETNKIAVLMRGFGIREGHDFLSQNILNITEVARVARDTIFRHVVYAAESQDYKVDIFVHSWNPNAEKLINELYNPLESMYEVYNSTKYPKIPNYSAESIRDIEAGLGMIKRKENSMGYQYDYILTSRFDAIFFQDIPFRQLTQGFIYTTEWCWPTDFEYTSTRGLKCKDVRLFLEEEGVVDDFQIMGSSDVMHLGFKSVADWVGNHTLIPRIYQNHAVLFDAFRVKRIPVGHIGIVRHGGLNLARYVAGYVRGHADYVRDKDFGFIPTEEDIAQMRCFQGGWAEPNFKMVFPNDPDYVCPSCPKQDWRDLEAPIPHKRWRDYSGLRYPSFRSSRCNFRVCEDPDHVCYKMNDLKGFQFPQNQGKNSITQTSVADAYDHGLQSSTTHHQPTTDDKDHLLIPERKDSRREGGGPEAPKVISEPNSKDSKAVQADVGDESKSVSPNGANAQETKNG